MLFSKRASQMKESPTVMWDMRIRDAILNDYSIINLTVGQPDFDTPRFFKNSAGNIIDEPKINYYTNPQGEKELRNLLLKLVNKSRNLDYVSEEIIWSSSKESLFLALSVLVDKEDEVIINMPCWPTYIEQVKLCEGKAIPVKTDENFHLRLNAIESAITKKTKVIIINSPNNPTGAVYNKAELEGLAELAIKYNLLILSDEVYGTILFGENVHQSIAALSGMKERTIIIDGFSKSMAMPGFRIGYAAGPKEIIEKMRDLKGNIFGNSDSFMQYAMMDAFKRHSESIDHFKEELKLSFGERKAYFSGELEKLGIKFTRPQGAFYFFIPIPEKEKDSVEFAEKMLFLGLGITPGKFFEKEGYVRISFAASMEKLKRAAEILAKAYSSD